MDVKWNSRKLAMAVILQAWTSYLLIAGHVTENIWMNVTTATILAYLTSQAYVDRRKGDAK